MIVVLLAFATGATKEVVLAGVPRVGERIRLSAGEPETPSLIVEQVLWLEVGNGAPGPKVVVSVRPTDT